MEQIPTIEIKSGNLTALIYPTMGGKLASLQFSGKELLFNNPVIQPGNLGRLNGWTSGGVEWNWPRLGHTVFHMKDVFAGIVRGDGGEEILRLYEFDRELNSTFSVDLYSPTDLDLLLIHVQLHNTNEHDIEGYWWSNIGVNVTSENLSSDRSEKVSTDRFEHLKQSRKLNVKSHSKGARVLYPADLAVVSTNTFHGGFNSRLEPMPFPFFSPFTNGTFPASTNDYSYPSQFYQARENFIVGNGTSTSRINGPSMAMVNDDASSGLIHFSTLKGRKFWVWGHDVLDYNRMMFLSTPGFGEYIEMQAGVAHTQSQTFPLKKKEKERLAEIARREAEEKEKKRIQEIVNATEDERLSFSGQLEMALVTTKSSSPLDTQSWRKYFCCVHRGTMLFFNSDREMRSFQRKNEIEFEPGEKKNDLGKKSIMDKWIDDACFVFELSNCDIKWQSRSAVCRDLTFRVKKGGYNRIQLRFLNRNDAESWVDALLTVQESEAVNGAIATAVQENIKVKHKYECEWLSQFSKMSPLERQETLQIYFNENFNAMMINGDASTLSDTLRYSAMSMCDAQIRLFYLCQCMHSDDKKRNEEVASAFLDFCEQYCSFLYTNLSRLIIGNEGTNLDDSALKALFLLIGCFNTLMRDYGPSPMSKFPTEVLEQRAAKHREKALNLFVEERSQVLEYYGENVKRLINLCAVGFRSAIYDIASDQIDSEFYLFGEHNRSYTQAPKELLTVVVDVIVRASDGVGGGEDAMHLRLNVLRNALAALVDHQEQVNKSLQSMEDSNVSFLVAASNDCVAWIGQIKRLILASDLSEEYSSVAQSFNDAGQSTGVQRETQTRYPSLQRKGSKIGMSNPFGAAALSSNSNPFGSKAPAPSSNSNPFGSKAPAPSSNLNPFGSKAAVPPSNSNPFGSKAPAPPSN
eukprot:g6498.t1